MDGVLSTRLPEELSERLSGYSFSRHPWVESKAEIYVLKHISEPTLYMKIRRDSRLLETEYNMLKWINHRIPTPDPHYYSRDESYEYLLTSEVTGTPTYQVKPHDRETAVRILAETLKQSHSLDVSGCPVIHSIENWVKTLEANGIDVSSLEEWRPVENLVFTHGDYCLPNLLIGGGVLSGVIDWDFAGLADPYVDFVSCMWSIRYNFGEEADDLIPLFLETYDVELDSAKYGFYKRLNELIP
ncbi:phosphotransferase [Candidatus Bathyarchaeota archaeon]|nr:phosphotransferase [Candidatus Bathyarchaeota archaeon]